MSIIRRIRLVMCFSLLLITQSSDLFAAPQPNSAESLFLEGVALLTEKRFDEACAKLEQSLALERNPSTLFALGECNEHRGQLVAGIKAYTAYIASYTELPDEKKPQHENRMSRAQERLETLQSQVSALTVVVLSTSTTGFEVSVDGEKTKTTNSAITFYPLEPVEHSVIVQVPEAEPKEVRVTLEKGKHRRLEIQIPIPSKPAQTLPKPHVETSFISPNPSQKPTAMKMGGIVGLGVGGAGLVIGIVGAAASNSKMDEVTQNCVLLAENPRAFCKNQAGVDAGNSAKAGANLATAGFGIAAAGAITGTILLLVDHRAANRSKETGRRILIPRFGADRSGVRVFLEGVW